MRKQEGKISISSAIVTLILIIILIITFNIYKLNNFNNFKKVVAEDKETEFTRDNKIKCSKYNSYKIQNSDYNDASFYKEIEVEPNTPYKISCMVKTENIVGEDLEKDVGATIGLLDTLEYSEPLRGTNDWQKVEYMFNSKNREKVKISFRLGGNQGKCTGTVWFSDFKIEKGIKNTNSEWNVGCFIVKELNVNIDGTQYNLKTSDEDIKNAQLNMERFKDICYNFSNKKMTVKYEINVIGTPVTTISYDEEHGNYLRYFDVKDLIYDTVKQKEYDYIFVVCRMEDEKGNASIPIIDNWIGLGSMDMYGIGYSLIRLNRNTNIFAYKYGITNQNPAEVYLHEFLHTLERDNKENDYPTPELHDYEKINYKNGETEDGLNVWYKDYMRKNILDSETNEYIGLDESVYLSKPPNNSNFRYAIEVNWHKEPSNIFEEVLTIINAVKRNFANHEV